MSNTGRHTRTGRGLTTLIGNGWLHEAPRRPQAWEHRSRSSLRKCLFLEVPPELRGALAAAARAAPPARVTPAALPPRPPPAPIEPKRRDPERDVRAFPAYHGPAAAGGLLRGAAVRLPKKERPASSAWWEDPIALGSLLILAPPIGLAAVWSSRRYSNDARWALTVMTALMMCLVTATVLVLYAVR